MQEPSEDQMRSYRDAQELKGRVVHREGTVYGTSAHEALEQFGPGGYFSVSGSPGPHTLIHQETGTSALCGGLGSCKYCDEDDSVFNPTGVYFI